jgi:hypothetical protein
MKNQLFHFPFEALVWLIGLACIALLDPTHDHFSICPFTQIGFDFCPGCGLGRSIGYLFRGEFIQSFKTHPLGLLAVTILTLRTITLTKNYLLSYGKNY